MADFNERCYSMLRKVPSGNVTTYKEIAKVLNTKAYRAVGNAMRNNPYAPEVPCHRVVKSDGTIGGFKGGTSGLTVKEKISMLRKEGIAVKQNNVLDFDKVLFKFN